MSDFAERRARVEAIVKAVHGRVIGHSRNVMHIEVPADVAAGMSTFWGMGGYRVIFSGQTTRLENRRIVNTQGHTVVCENDPVLTAFYHYDVDLEPAAAAKPAPSAADITRPVKP
jgi:hypothetical protein